MASSRRLNAANLLSHVVSIVQTHVPPDATLCVGLSGGRDSVVLLHLLAAAQQMHRMRLSAIHVNHQISPNADHWAEFCVALCAKWDVPLRVERVRIARDSGKGLEASAREARYGAYAHTDASVIALAHHRDDQAETVLLQALRGAGLKGISAMPQWKSFGEAKAIFRPLLNVAPEVLADYAEANTLPWIHDESNDNTKFTRNFLRHDIFPRLTARAPQCAENLARLSRHAAEVQSLLDDLAKIDFDNVAVNGKLSRSRLLSLGSVRAKNLLRFSIAQAAIPLPNSIQLQEILHQLTIRQLDDKTEIAWAEWRLRCYGDDIHFMPAAREKKIRWQMPWRGEPELRLPHGVLHVDRTPGAGVAEALIAGKNCTIRSRVGGEKFRVSMNRPQRSLKNLLQETRVPPWQRDIMPLLFCEETLVWAPDIGVHANFVVQGGEPGLCFAWQR